MASLRALRYLLAASACAAGCSGGDSPPDSGHPPDLRPAADATDVIEPTCADLSTLVVSAAELCNTLPFPSTRVPFTAGSGSTPSFTGGTLVDGLYAAIKSEGWGTTAGRGRQMGIVIGDDGDEGKLLLWFGQTLNPDGSGDVDAGTGGLGWLRANYRLTAVSDNTLALDETCLVGTTSGPPQLLYTVAATDPPQLILANAGSPSAAVVTYERQGCP